MTEEKARTLLTSRRTPLIVSLLTILLLLTGNLPWQLEDYDQAKQAFTSWEMVKSGRLSYQETPSGRIATKPPLVGWVSAAVYACTRSWDIAWRLPSFAAALTIAWLLWRRGTVHFGRMSGLLALAAFGFNLLTPRIATLVRTDMPLALATFLIALLFFEKIRAGESWRSRDRTALFFLLTASMLIKGPIVYAFVLPALLWFALIFRHQRASIATRWWPWIGSLAIFLVWVIGGIRTVPGFYEEVVLREFAGRFGETIHRPQPFLFYVPHLLHKFAPWSALLIGLLVVNARAPGALARARRLRWLGQFRPETFWLLAWALGGLLVMSCIPSKRVDRIFPIIAPLCLLLGALAAEVKGPKIARWCVATLGASIVFAGSYTGFKIVSGFFAQRDALVKCGREFRMRAARQRWRYALVRDEKEALVMYFDVTGSLNQDEVVKRWNAGQLDAIVVSEWRLESLLPRLKPLGVASELCQSEEGKIRYTVVTRQE